MHDSCIKMSLNFSWLENFCFASMFELKMNINELKKIQHNIYYTLIIFLKSKMVGKVHQ